MITFNLIDIQSKTALVQYANLHKEMIKLNPLLNAFLIDENTSVSDLENSLSIIQKEIEKRKEQKLDEARLKLRDYAKSLGVPLEKLIEEPKGSSWRHTPFRKFI